MDKNYTAKTKLKNKTDTHVKQNKTKIKQHNAKQHNKDTNTYQNTVKQNKPNTKHKAKK